MTTLRRRIGVEIELLAPPGVDRGVLARRVAHASGGAARRVFHTDSEPSLVPGMGHFWHLTPAWEVSDAHGAPVASFVDDITIADDLRRGHEEERVGRAAPVTSASPSPDLWRVLSDDPRLLRLVADHSDPDAPFHQALNGIARLFATDVDVVGGVRRLRDRSGASIAMAAPLAPGRERPCEIVTAPLIVDHEAALEALLRPARELGFTVPLEAAVHLHVDGEPFRSAHAFANLVRLVGNWRGALHELLGTNPACTRLAPMPPPLLALVEEEGAEWAAWAAARHADATSGGGAASAQRWHRLQQAAAGTGLTEPGLIRPGLTKPRLTKPDLTKPLLTKPLLTKYMDVNLTALLTDSPARDTVEVRILPGSLSASDITGRARLVEALLDRCLEEAPLPRPTTAASVTPDRAVAELRRLAGV
ncbi:amidoligase family protein [Frigoribacterium sp. ACAM 257]|uniref:amidoligase family protein n=1 Tax=Frigoribacterium sp. ACAM 257 TaxID=2508998 RepID=UPI001CB9A957|nr:amidoligase family protein [Frigoribacterium sp. ACAM 257]